MIRYCLLLIITIASAESPSLQTPAKFYAGFRASRVLSSYPNNQFPQTEYWIKAAKEISGKFPGSIPAGIWILSLYQSGGNTQISFPSGGRSIPYVQFTSVDYNESHLTKLDTSGVKVWLQVEPGAASMDTLISIVLNSYKHHPCIIGFGVDVEWFYTNTNSGGRKLTDSMVARWDQKVRSIDSTYTLFIKHYGQSWMPPTYRGTVLFVDDSQDFTFSANPFNTMVSEFKSWGTKFSPANSAFQFGYKADSVWWRPMTDPMKTIGEALRSNIPTCAGVFWVDFTIGKIIPITSVKDQQNIPDHFKLLQNYPNPFNPTTIISYRLLSVSQTKLSVYDVIGREVDVLVNEVKASGTYSVTWDASHYADGIYLAKLTSGGKTETHKMLLVK
jgi:hypothetical protein